MIRRHAQPLGQGRDHFAEAAGQDVDALGVALEEVDVAANGDGRLVQNPVGQGLDVFTTQGQQFQALF